MSFGSKNILTKKMEKKKTLHLITGLEIGGTEMMLLKILSRMQNDFDNRVCCIIGHGPMGKKLEEAGIIVYYLDLKNVFDLGIIWRFRKTIKEFQPEILATYLIHSDLFGRIFGRLFGIKKIICSRQGSLLQWDFLKYFDRMTKFLVTRYMVLTEVEKSILVKTLAIKKEKIMVNPNGLDIKEFDFEIDKQSKKVELGIQNENINIVCVSKLRNGKGHEYLLEAFEALYKKNNKLNLLIVGGGERESFLLDLITNYESKGNIYFLGNRTDVREILKISDIFVMPTLAEGMSTAILEAMASRLPIITTNIPANKELIQNMKNGFLVSPKNVPEIAEKINVLINCPDLRQEIGNSARKKVESEFNLDLTVKIFAKLLNEV